MENMSVAVAQLNTQVGDIAGNLTKILQAWDEAEKNGVDLVLTPELSLSGYPLEDFIENPDLLEKAQQAIKILVEKSKTMKSGVVVGAPMKGACLDDGRNVYNKALLIADGKIQHSVSKQHLPTYDVFDEKRNNAEGEPSDIIEFKGVKFGLMICEDTWYPDVAQGLAKKGAQAILSINSSPYEQGKQQRRLDSVLRARASETNLPVIYACQVGGQDEVVFDGASMAVNNNGELMYAGPAFEESLDIIKIKSTPNLPVEIVPGARIETPMTDLEADWSALVVGTRDYIRKNFGTDKHVVLGMSGGLDSAVVAAIAVDAIGADNVHLISMPTKYNSAETKNDARDAAKMLNAPFEELPIGEAQEGLQNTLGEYFNAQSKGVANENMQARLRGTILMHVSNENHWLLLSTGNKSEVSVGYCTLYGDMNGGFNPLKDVLKTHAFRLAEWRNKHKPAIGLGPDGSVMPESIITRPPSAELAEGQMDSNALPEYEVLDRILESYVEQDKSIPQIADETGYDRTLIEDIVKKVDIAEFKRRQACPGVKITERNFGRGRRFPISRPTMPSMISAMDGFEYKPNG